MTVVRRTARTTMRVVIAIGGSPAGPSSCRGRRRRSIPLRDDPRQHQRRAAPRGHRRRLRGHRPPVRRRAGRRVGGHRLQPLPHRAVPLPADQLQRRPRDGRPAPRRRAGRRRAGGAGPAGAGPRRAGAPGPRVDPRARRARWPTARTRTTCCWPPPSELTHLLGLVDCRFEVAAPRRSDPAGHPPRRHRPLGADAVGRRAVGPPDRRCRHPRVDPRAAPRAVRAHRPRGASRCRPRSSPRRSRWSTRPARRWRRRRARRERHHRPARRPTAAEQSTTAPGAGPGRRRCAAAARPDRLPDQAPAARPPAAQRRDGAPAARQAHRAGRVRVRQPLLERLRHRGDPPRPRADRRARRLLARRADHAGDGRRARVPDPLLPRDDQGVPVRRRRLPRHARQLRHRPGPGRRARRCSPTTSSPWRCRPPPARPRSCRPSSRWRRTRCRSPASSSRSWPSATCGG